MLVRTNGKSTHGFRLSLTTLLATVLLLLGCAGSPSGDETRGSKSASTDAKSRVASDSSATWIATLDHGDKPGNGYELIVDEAVVTSGKFYLLDPNKPHDLKSAGQIAAFENLKAEGRKITFSIRLKTGNGEYRETLTLALDDP